jgi:hypothetical protein
MTFPFQQGDQRIMKQHLRRMTLAATVCAIAACSPPAAIQPAAPSGAQVPAGTQAAGGAQTPQASPAGQGAAVLLPALRPVKDPAGTEQIKVREYWDFDKHSVMEVENFVATFGADHDKDGKQETRLAAQVKLPTKKTLALLQVDEEEGELDEDEEASDDEVAEADEEDLDEEDLDEEDDLEEEEELDEFGEDILDMDADGDWDEDDDGYTDAYEDEADDDTREEYSEAEEAAALSGPHDVVMEIENEASMSESADTVWVSDLTAGEDIAITCDQDWTYFELESGDESLRVAFNPDGTYTIGDQPAANQAAAVALLKQSPLVQGTSRHALAFIAARLGRLPSESSRMPMPPKFDKPGKGSGFGRYVLATEATTPERAFALTNALVEALVQAGE